MVAKSKSKPNGHTPWQNRIIGTGNEAPDQLLASDSNWRIHSKRQQDALTAVLDKVGWVQNVIVNQRSQTVIDGHLRVALAISRNEPTIPVVYVDLTEQEEKLVLASLDTISHMAVTDDEMLAGLLKDIQSEDETLTGLMSELASEMGTVLGNVEFKEYDESIADHVAMVECPECGHKFPK